MKEETKTNQRSRGMILNFQARLFEERGGKRKKARNYVFTFYNNLAHACFPPI